MKIYQDGREFFDDETGDEIFQSSILVTDHDTYAAEKAREEFLCFAQRSGITVEWVGP